MKSFRISALTSLALLFCAFLAACGGSSAKPPAPPSPPVVTSSDLPLAAVNTAYSYTLQGSGGTGTFTWSISAGSLPPGLTLNTQTALISGTPTTFGTYNFVAKVTDGANMSGTANLSISVEGAILVTCSSGCTGNHLPSGAPGVPYGPFSLTATGGQSPYSWCVVETNGTCDNGSQGALPPGLTISTSGAISGTPTSAPAAPVTFTAQATDSETIPSRGSAQFVISIFGIGTSSLPAGVEFTPYNQRLSAGGGVAPYTWSISSGSLPPGLSLDPSTCTASRGPVCNILGAPTSNGNFAFTVTAQDGETPPATSSVPLSIQVSARISNASLSGNYAFTFSGFQNGNPIIMAGAFMTPGDGTISGGKIDVNDGSGEPNDPSQCRGNPSCPIAQVIVPASSSYDLSSGTGLGTMTLVATDNGGTQHTYAFAISVASASACAVGLPQSTCGRLIQSDPNQPQSYGSGVLKVQNSQYFSISKFFPGQFALLFSGIDPNGKRYAGAGAMATNAITLVDIDCNSNGWGLTAGCPTDVNDNGAAAQNPLKGSFASDLDTTYGRGNFLNLAFPTDPNNLCIGPPNGTDCGYAYYIVNQQEMILISSDPLSKPANLTLWTASKQPRTATGWSLGTLNKTYATELNALDPNSGNPVPDITAGLLHADGAGNGTFNYDENQGGTLSQQSSAGTYAIDASGQKTGRVTLTGFTPFGSAVMYLVQPGTPGYAAAFLVGGDTEVTSGLLEQQGPGPFTNASLIGSYGGGTVWPVLSGVTNSATFLFADGGGNVTANQDTSGPAGPATDNLTLTYQVDSTGRAVVRQNGTQFGILYVVSPTKVVFLPGGTAPALSVLTSGPDNN